MPLLRDTAFIACISLLAFSLGCEPVNLAEKNTKTGTEIELCCEEPTPSLADARKAAMNKSAKDAEPKTPTIIAPKSDDKKVEETVGLTPVEKREPLGLDFTLTDQDGKPFELKSIKGKPTVVTFIFTRCPNPNMCPLQGVKMAALQKDLEKAGLSDKVNLLLITFDPDYDTPTRLKTWGETNGVKYTNAKMLQPDLREFTDFRYEFGFRAFVVDGKLDHKTDLFLIDHEAKVAAFYGGLWDDAKTLADVKQLISEMK